MNFKKYVALSEQLRVRKTAPKGDGYYFSFYDGRKRVGHVGGIEHRTHERNKENELVLVHYFDVMNVNMEEAYRGKGLFQPILQQIADGFSDGIRSMKLQTSPAFSKAMRKMPTYREDDRNHFISPRGGNIRPAGQYVPAGPVGG